MTEDAKHKKEHGKSEQNKAQVEGQQQNQETPASQDSKMKQNQTDSTEKISPPDSKQDTSKPNSGQDGENKEKDTISKEKKEIKPKSELETLQEKYKKIQEDLETQKSKYRYLQAELENTRKHYIKQQEVVRLKAKVDTITAFTPLIEAFEKAFETAQKQREAGNQTLECQIDDFLAGFQKLYDMVRGIFKSYHVVPIEKTRVPFNYNSHEVMLKTVNDDIPEDTVVQIIQKGYRINDQVIKPAKVIVSKHSPPPPPPKKEEKSSSPELEKPQGKKEGTQATPENHESSG